jgi:hypothetical protein
MPSPDLRRARLYVQLSYLALAEADAIWTGYEWPPVQFETLPTEPREQHAHLSGLSERLYAEARSLGFTGGKTEAGL